MKTHLIFDLDGTICESRQGISYLMLEKLSKLGTDHDIVVISGAEKERMVHQLGYLKANIMAQSGNDTLYWQNKLTNKEIKEIYEHIEKMVNIKPDMVQNRGCQISLSFTGHHANTEDKKNFDPSGTKRLDILKEYPFKSQTLECKVAGNTCLDYTRKNGTKGKNIERLIKFKKWNKKSCVYFGDKLFKGGNDESVIGVIDTVEVANPQELLVKLSNYE